MLAAIQADAMVQMGRRPGLLIGLRSPIGVSRCGRGSVGREFVPDEIGVLLGWTKMAAAARYATACRAAELPLAGQGVAGRPGRRPQGRGDR